MFALRQPVHGRACGAWPTPYWIKKGAASSAHGPRNPWLFLSFCVCSPLHTVCRRGTHPGGQFRALVVPDVNGMTVRFMPDLPVGRPVPLRSSVPDWFCVTQPTRYEIKKGAF
jgi:hypothetical protein